MKERRWYADWRVWFCFALVAVCGLLERIIGLPFRLIEAIWNFVF
jgi:hypothetical protein